MVDPDKVRSIKQKSITTPYILRIQISYLDILDDDIRCIVGELQTFALDDSTAPTSKNRLRRSDSQRTRASLVPCRCQSFCTAAGTRVFNDFLACTAGPPGGAHIPSYSTF